MARTQLGPKQRLAKRLSKQDKTTTGLSTRDVLKNASITSGNLTILNGGSIIVAAGGSIQLAAGNITATNVSATAALSGSTISGTTLTLSGTGSGPAFVGNDLYTLNGPSYNITGGRVTCWLETATGRVGMATSSERFKVIMGDGEIDTDAVLSLQIVRYQYKAEVAKRDDPDSEDYIGPEYEVRTEIGLIAEHLDAAGLKEWVFYESDEVTPRGIHYGDFVVPLLAVAQRAHKELAALRRENGEFRDRLERAGL